MRTTCSTEVTKILPSPILPVRADLTIASIALSTWFDATTTSIFTLGRKSTTYSALRESGCAAARTGWRPQFLLLRRAGALAGAMPLFAKTHSYGEYVFDWAWADAHERNGVEYYPKLLGAVPFTPVRGARILGDREPLIAAALEMAKGYSSFHVLFARDDEADSLQKKGLLLRRTVQFHWKNEGYADFEDFLSRLSHARRKNIRQERRKVREAGVTVRELEGAQI